MASSFKTLTPNDKTSTKTLLHEAIPLTGTIVSGTYSDNNIKTYAHGMFTSVYDYPYLSSSANHIFDLAVGYSANSPASGTSGKTQQDKKINMYNAMAQVLAGFDPTGVVWEFDKDGTFGDSTGLMQSCFFINFARILGKDEISKGTFSISLLASGSHPSPHTDTTLTDGGSATNYKVNSPAGTYGLLKNTAATDTGVYGLIYYQAGVAVITGSVFADATGFTSDDTDANRIISEALTGSTIDEFTAGLRRRWTDCSFNNTTELNSTIYFCRAQHSDFNYSSNPTYLENSQIFVKVTPDDLPTTYFTTVGLYSPDNELLAVAKLSEPLKKTSANELTLRVRLDY